MFITVSSICKSNHIGQMNSAGRISAGVAGWLALLLGLTLNTEVPKRRRPGKFDALYKFKIFEIAICVMEVE